MDIDLSDKYELLWTAPESVRYFIITGGRGSQKSFATSTFLTNLTFEAGTRTLFTRYTLTAAHKSIIPELLEKTVLLGYQDIFKPTLTTVTNLKTGSDIMFSGIKTSSGIQTANLQSLHGVTTWVMDEAQEFPDDETTFDSIDFSIRKKGQHNRVIILMNPATKQHLIYKKFFESRGVQPGFNGIVGDVAYIHTTFFDNIKNLNEKIVESWRDLKRTNPEKYDHVIMGGWLGKAEGVIFDKFEIGESPDDIDKIEHGMDLGFSGDPTSLCETKIDSKNKILYLRELCYDTGMLTSEIHSLLIRTAGKNLVWADSAEPRLIEELNILGSNVQAVIKGSGSIVEGIQLMKEWKIVIHPESLNAIREANNYCWSSKKSGVPRDLYNHFWDAARYSVISYLRGSGDYYVY